MSAQAGPVTIVVDCSTATEIACRDNEMGYMFYRNLGGTLGQNKTGTQTALGGEVLPSIQNAYWSGTDFNASLPWLFVFGNGEQANGILKVGYLNLFAWAVRDGDVPEPASLLLIGVGALALGWSRRRGRRR